MSAFCFGATGPVAQLDLERAIARLQAAFGPDLLRVKGLVALRGPGTGPGVLHVVGHAWSPLKRLDLARGG